MSFQSRQPVKIGAWKNTAICACFGTARASLPRFHRLRTKFRQFQMRIDRDAGRPCTLQQLANEHQVTVARGARQTPFFKRPLQRDPHQLRDRTRLVRRALAVALEQPAQKFVEPVEVFLRQIAKTVDTAFFAQKATEQGENHSGLPGGLEIPRLVAGFLGDQPLRRSFRRFQADAPSGHDPAPAVSATGRVGEKAGWFCVSV